MSMTTNNHDQSHHHDITATTYQFGENKKRQPQPQQPFTKMPYHIPSWHHHVKNNHHDHHDHIIHHDHNHGVGSSSSSSLNVICMLEILPIELIQYEILYPYCDGKSLSTFAYALISLTDIPTSSSCDRHHHMTMSSSRSLLKATTLPSSSSSCTLVGHHPLQQHRHDGINPDNPLRTKKNSAKLLLSRMMIGLSRSSANRSDEDHHHRHNSRGGRSWMMKKEEGTKLLRRDRNSAVLEETIVFEASKKSLSYDDNYYLTKERCNIIVWEMIPQIGQQRLHHLANLMEQSVHRYHRHRKIIRNDHTNGVGHANLPNHNNNNNSSNSSHHHHNPIDTIQHSYALNAIAWIRSIATSIELMVMLPPETNTTTDHSSSSGNSDYYHYDEDVDIMRRQRRHHHDDDDIHEESYPRQSIIHRPMSRILTFRHHRHRANTNPLDSTSNNNHDINANTTTTTSTTPLPHRHGTTKIKRLMEASASIIGRRHYNDRTSYDATCCYCSDSKRRYSHGIFPCHRSNSNSNTNHTKTMHHHRNSRNSDGNHNSSSSTTICSYHQRIRIMNYYCHYIQKLSHFMALMDFLECCIYQYSNIDEGQYNWEMVCHCLRAYSSCCHTNHNHNNNHHNNHLIRNGNSNSSSRGGNQSNHRDHPNNNNNDVRR